MNAIYKFWELRREFIGKFIIERPNPGVVETDGDTGGCGFHQYSEQPRRHTTTGRSSSTLWSYKLILNHLLKYRTKFHYIDFVWPLTPSSLMDIWHLVSNKQVICKKCLEMAIRKKVRFLGLAQIYLFLMDKFLKKRNLWHKKVFIIG